MVICNQLIMAKKNSSVLYLGFI